jgi:hypothetical protein
MSKSTLFPNRFALTGNGWGARGPSPFLIVFGLMDKNSAACSTLNNLGQRPFTLTTGAASLSSAMNHLRPATRISLLTHPSLSGKIREINFSEISNSSSFWADGKIRNSRPLSRSISNVKNNPASLMS